jgi:hypothetical protein
MQDRERERERERETEAETFYLTMSSSVVVRTRDGQNDGKPTQYTYRYKTVYVGCTGRTLVVSSAILLSVYAT